MDIDPHDPSHPASRPMEPDHPLILDGGVVPGDAELMVRCMIEELLQVGLSRRELLGMSRDPNYQGLFAARRDLGDARMDELMEDSFNRVGRHRHRTVEFTGEVQSATLTVGGASKEHDHA